MRNRDTFAAPRGLPSYPLPGRAPIPSLKGEGPPLQWLCNGNDGIENNNSSVYEI